MKPSWKIAALLVAIVLLSGAAGFFLGAQVTRAKSRARNNPDAWNLSVMKTLERRLALTPAQRDKVQAIIDGGVLELKAIRLRTVGETNAVIERLIQQVDAELTPPQQEKFSQLKKSRSPTTIDLLKVEPRR